jgi:hypothetical protein
MSDHYTTRIKELEAERRKDLRQAKRASERRRKALKARKWPEARRSLKTARRNRREAQDKRKRISLLRKARSHANWLARVARHKRPVVGKRGVSWYDGKQVASWLVPYLQWARKNGWNGRLVSGWRDPAYSEKLCWAMCGRPSCPGRCAGRNSNHSGSVPHAGAVDVSSYTQFGALMKRCPYSPRIFNGLGARDPVHFSASGG